MLGLVLGAMLVLPAPAASPAWAAVPSAPTLAASTDPNHDDEDDDNDSAFCIINSLSLIVTLGVCLFLTTRNKPAVGPTAEKPGA